MSGVARLRQAHKDHPTMRRANPKPGSKDMGEGFERTNDYNEVKCNPDVGSGLAPTKSRGWLDGNKMVPGIVGPPMSDEMPSRGEYTKKRGDQNRHHQR